MGPTIAQTSNACKGAPFNTFSDILTFISCTINKSIIPLLFTLATAGFIWGIIQYFLNPDNEEKRKWSQEVFQVSIVFKIGNK